MGIHEEARLGTLTEVKLANYLREDPNRLNEQDPDTPARYTPLASAAVNGHAKVVDLLLRNKADPDAPCANDARPLHLVAQNWQGPKGKQGPIIKLLLGNKPPPEVVDRPLAPENNTALMLILKKRPIDLDSIKLLRKAGASPTLKNALGESATTLAQESNDKRVRQAVLNPNASGRSGSSKVIDAIITFLGLILAAVNTFANSVITRVFKKTPKVPSDVARADKVDGIIQKQPAFERFFKGNPTFIKDFAAKAAGISEITGDNPELQRKLITVSLHQQVIYCDE
ncbi:hypothetical protein AA313_de0209677 [Arthrobotrys entomopaga]|nr:hypothetical protein AA313_de0209677 [Arthrobotrys entomopaga]